MLQRSPYNTECTYRVVLISGASHRLLVRYDSKGYRLPHIGIPPGVRPAEGLQSAVATAWHLHVIVLDFLPSQEPTPPVAVLRTLSAEASAEFLHIDLDQLDEFELNENQRATVREILAGHPNARGCFSRFGWIDEALQWLYTETKATICSTDEIRQYNASGTFALIRFPTVEGCAYWLKATGTPNAHEYAITALLSRTCPDSLPPLISMKRDWNAWLTRESGQPFESALPLFALEHAVLCISELQKRALVLKEELVAAGAIDQSVSVIREHLGELFDYLQEAMALQNSMKAPRLGSERLKQIANTLSEAFKRMEDSEIPDSLIHGDLNQGNLLFDGSRCRLIDWSEAYLGNPFVTFQHLLLLNKGYPQRENTLRLKTIFKRSWLSVLSPAQIDTGFALMSLLAIASSLYGRGNWLKSPRRNDPAHQSYARSLARHMDRATHEAQLREVLCH